MYKLRTFVPIIFFWLGLKAVRSNVHIEQSLVEPLQFPSNPLMMGFKQRAIDWLLNCALSLNLAASESSCLYLGKAQTPTWQVEVLSFFIPKSSFLA